MIYSETELAKGVIVWLQSLRWVVYQEVQIHRNGSVADIVAVQGRLIWVIECKTSLGLTVIEQADAWRPYAHYVSVAAPYGRNNQMRDKILRWLGIGRLAVDAREVSEKLAPSLNRRGHFERMHNTLTPMHQTYAEAGNAHGRRWTPFQQTCTNVLAVVQERPGLTMRTGQ